jgi:hypothetical protein
LCRRQSLDHIRIDHVAGCDDLSVPAGGRTAAATYVMQTERGNWQKAALMIDLGQNDPG